MKTDNGFMQHGIHHLSCLKLGLITIFSLYQLITRKKYIYIFRLLYHRKLYHSLPTLHQTTCVPHIHFSLIFHYSNIIYIYIHVHTLIQSSLIDLNFSFISERIKEKLLSFQKWGLIFSISFRCSSFRSSQPRIYSMNSSSCRLSRLSSIITMVLFSLATIPSTSSGTVTSPPCNVALSPTSSHPSLPLPLHRQSPRGGRPPPCTKAVGPASPSGISTSTQSYLLANLSHVRTCLNWPLTMDPTRILSPLSSPHLTCWWKVSVWQVAASIGGPWLASTTEPSSPIFGLGIRQHSAPVGVRGLFTSRSMGPRTRLWFHQTAT